MSEKEITDLSYLHEMAMGDVDIVIETTTVFLDDTPAALSDFREHYTNQDWEKLFKIAHKIKPNMTYMGMHRAKDLIIEIEQEAKTERFSDNFDSKVKAFDALCSQALKELSTKVEKLKSS